MEQPSQYLLCRAFQEYACRLLQRYFLRLLKHPFAGGITNEIGDADECDSLTFPVQKAPARLVDPPG